MVREVGCPLTAAALIILLNLAFAIYMLYVLLAPHVEKHTQENGVLAQMAHRMRTFTSSSWGRSADEDDILEAERIRTFLSETFPTSLLLKREA